MQRIYSHENRYLVLNAKNLLQLAGIEVQLKNEFAGGASGLLAPLETWLELWLVNDQDAERATAILAEIQTTANHADWLCPYCGEYNDPSFASCWKCQQDKPLETLA